MSTAYEPIDGEIIRTTPRAVLVRVSRRREVWVPRSLCEGGDTLDVGDDDIRVAAWWAVKEGLA